MGFLPDIKVRRHSNGVGAPHVEIVDQSTAKIVDCKMHYCLVAYLAGVGP